MSIYRLFLFTGIVFNLYAGDFDRCHFYLECSPPGQDKFSIELKSVSGDCSEDDMEVYLNKKNQKLKMNIKPELFYYTDHISKTQPSICKGKDKKGKAKLWSFAAYMVSKNEALFFIKSNGRPGYDNVNAMLMNVISGQVVDWKTLGGSKNSFILVLKSKNGFKLRIVNNSLSLAGKTFCDCDAAVVDAWLEILVKKGKIITRWI